MNLISICYVIKSQDFGVEPIVYLNRPTLNPNEEVIHFPDPFTAKAFVQLHNPNAPKIMVTSEIHSQMHVMGF